MIGIIISFIASAATLFITAKIVPGFEISDFNTLIVAAIVFGIINAIIKPVLKIISLPITLITLGIFAIIINAFCVALAAWFVPGFEISGILPAIIGAIVISIVSALIGFFTKSLDKTPIA
jgi:putative membrane protein